MGFRVRIAKIKRITDAKTSTAARQVTKSVNPKSATSSTQIRAMAVRERLAVSREITKWSNPRPIARAMMSHLLPGKLPRAAMRKMANHSAMPRTPCR